MNIAGAPISWGVCEVPGWGFQLAPDRVLREMADLGLTATEFGPQGWLPIAPAERAAAIAPFGLKAVGAFVPVLLHDPAHDPAPAVELELDSFEAAGGDVLVLAAATGTDGYDTRPELDAAGWTTLLANLDRLQQIAADRGIRATLHPHVGTMVETADDVDKVLRGSTIQLCLDTGHLLIGGSDPAQLAETWAARINHVHAKDVRADLAAKVRSGELTYTDAVRAGIYVPLGQGDVDLPRIVHALEAAGFDGWYVLEQDTILATAPDDEGPVADVRMSMAYLRSLSA
ncbi:2-keto-myo-inositol dehydratase [Sanguibacter gelidistatuariae]|uniref:2-keto-myo-inositol dehydratase n=1 Tax=Sanguibacter gelidistatuariae TaxID=1814289 RepID=A0A1G6HP91_9MICO|nr:TIM barrel protein [Sanguibacter gelidistatuariae]SDB96089.1 2-keto-myo-inositol dehydratase [Sanguibacter gelidistatuariae]